MNKPRPLIEQESKRDYWQRQISAFEAANQNAAQFCRDQGLSYHSFKNWQKKIAFETISDISQRKQTKKFVRLQTATPIPPTLMKCRFPNGFELSWESSTPAAAVSAIIQEVGRL